MWGQNTAYGRGLSFVHDSAIAQFEALGLNACSSQRLTQAKKKNQCAMIKRVESAAPTLMRICSSVKTSACIIRFIQLIRMPDLGSNRCTVSAVPARWTDWPTWMSMSRGNSTEIIVPSAIST